MSNKFTEKKIQAEVLAELYDIVARKERDVHQSYQVVGKEEEQATDWRTNELLWEDDEKTIPRYRDKYDYVPKKDEDLSDDELTQIKVYKRIMADLEKML